MMYKQSIILALFTIMLSACSVGLKPSQSKAALDSGRLHGFLDQPVVTPAHNHDEQDLFYRYLLSEMALQKGQLELAVEYMLTVSERIENARLAERTARIAVYAKDHDRALSATERWLSLEPDNLDAHQAAAALNIRLGRAEQALRHAREIIRLSEDEQGFMLVAGLLGNEEARETALEVMGQLVEQYQHNPAALYAYGSVAAQFGRLQSAKHLMTAALILRPSMMEALTAKARIMYELGETEAAIAELAAAINRYPDDEKMVSAYGRLLVSAKRYPEAVKVYQTLLAQAPHDENLVYTLALLTLELEQYDIAQGYFLQLLEFGERNDEVQYYLGRIAEKQQDFKAALHHYRHVVQGNYRLDAQLRAAMMLGELGRLQEARLYLQDLRGVNAEASLTVRSYLVESELLRESKAYEEALALLNDALLGMPDNHDLLYARALIAEKLDRLEMVEQDLRAILANEPENAEVLNALGYTLADRTRRYQEAHALISQAMQLKPDDAAITDSYGWVLYRLGRYKEAVTYLQQALNLQYDAEIAAHLGEVLWVSGDEQAARRVWQQALDKMPEHETLLKVIKRFAQ